MKTDERIKKYLNESETYSNEIVSDMIDDLDNNIFQLMQSLNLNTIEDKKTKKLLSDAYKSTNKLLKYLKLI